MCSKYCVPAITSKIRQYNKNILKKNCDSHSTDFLSYHLEDFLRAPVGYTAPIGSLLPSVLVSWTAFPLPACIPVLKADAVSSKIFVTIRRIIQHIWEDINHNHTHSLHAVVNKF
jgi:hypothetical protein